MALRLQPFNIPRKLRHLSKVLKAAVEQMDKRQPIEPLLAGSDPKGAGKRNEDNSP
jgi:hypothetical protein